MGAWRRVRYTVGNALELGSVLWPERHFAGRVVRFFDKTLATRADFRSVSSSLSLVVKMRLSALAALAVCVLAVHVTG